jgi:hypothetical protein
MGSGRAMASPRMLPLQGLASLGAHRESMSVSRFLHRRVGLVRQADALPAYPSRPAANLWWHSAELGDVTTYTLMGALPTAMLAGCDGVDRLAADEDREVVAEAARDVRETVGSIADTEVDRARDAAIAAEISARLARDPDLSALGIDVDATRGRVVLQGSAPDREARDRATVLAWGVYGVVGVNNKMRAENRN